MHKVNKGWKVGAAALAVMVALAGLFWAATTGLPELTASYLTYDSVDELAAGAGPGDRVKVPLAPVYSSSDWQYEQNGHGLVVKTPPAGFKTGRHIYYLRIVRQENRASMYLKPGDSGPPVPYLIAEVVRIE